MVGGMGVPFSGDILRALKATGTVWWGWLGSQNGVRGASVEGVCAGATVGHNMERGEFDFKETQPRGGLWEPGSRRL